MSIDLFTLVSQIINLLILLFLLRKFLYLPVLKAVEARQRAIAEELQQAEKAQRRAEDIEAECRQKLRDIENEKQEILLAAKEEAHQLWLKLSAENQHLAQQDREQWLARFKTEQKNFEIALQRLIVEYFNHFASKAIKQMADISLNDLVVQQFKQKILQLSAKERKELAAAYKNKKQVVIHTAEKLSAATEKDLQLFVGQQFNLSENTKFKFEENKELISGIALQAEEELISWSLETYLQDFRRHLSDEITQLLNRG